MIVYPQNLLTHTELAGFLQKYAFVKDTSDAKLIGWIDEKTRKILGVVCLNNFIGKVCQMHVASLPGYGFAPRGMLEAVFRHAFGTFGCEKVIGIVNSRNSRAMRFDLRLGFEESYRMPGLHDDGGDIVFLTMSKDQCRFLKRQEEKEAA